jgi:hypothetical protein
VPLRRTQFLNAWKATGELGWLMNQDGQVLGAYPGLFAFEEHLD